MRVSGKNVFRELEYKKVKKIYLSKNFNNKEIMDIIKDNKLSYIFVDNKKLDSMLQNNQGIIVEIDDYEYKTLDIIDDNFVVILDHLEDPHNFGAIIRTCESRGIKNIVIPKDRSVCVNEIVMKTSVGALNHINIIRATNLVDTINKLKNKGFFIYGAEADGIDYKKVSYADKICLVIGSEGNGIGNLVRKNCDEIISLPMRGKINSLNASVAAAILIYGIGD